MLELWNYKIVIVLVHFIKFSTSLTIHSSTVLKPVLLILITRNNEMEVLYKFHFKSKS